MKIKNPGKIVQMLQIYCEKKYFFPRNNGLNIEVRLPINWQLCRLADK